MADKNVRVRIVAEGGKQVKAEFDAIGRSGQEAFSRVGRAGGNFSGSLQNVGFQVQDFAVQVAGGTSASRALAQQLPQLLSGFGLLGVGLGTAVAVFVPFISSLFESGEKAKDTAKAVSEAEAAVRSYMNAIKSANAPMSELVQQFRSQADEIRKLRQEALSLEAEAVSRSIMKARDELNSSFDDIGARLDRIKAATDAVAAIPNVPQDQLLPGEIIAVQNLRLEIERLKNETGLTVEQAQALQSALGNPSGSASMAEIAAQARAAVAALSAAVDAGAKLPDGALEAARQMVTLAESAAMASAQMEDIANTDIASPITAGANAAAALAANLRAAANQYVEFNKPGGTASLAAQYASYGAGRANMLEAANDAKNNATIALIPKIKASGGGGGGGGTDPDLAKIKSLFDQTRTSAEKYAAELAEVQRLYREGDIDGDLYARAVKRLDEQFGKVSDSAQQSAQAIRSAFDGIFDDPAEALKNLAKQLAQMALYQGLSKAFPSIFGAGGYVPLVKSSNGNVFSGGNVIPFATGGIVSRPTIFPMAKGTGLMGEAGPEAILPLTRIGGKLGVAAAGGGGTSVTVINNSGQPSRQERSQGPDGREIIRVVVGEEISRGRFDKPMRRFGATPDRVVR